MFFIGKERKKERINVPHRVAALLQRDPVFVPTKKKFGSNKKKSLHHHYFIFLRV
jgi:hypothetical protein